MADAASRQMTSDEFMTWAEQQPGRYELHGGLVIAMAPERNRHALVKLDAAMELHRAIRLAGVDCRVFPDGTAVRIDRTTTYEPDVLIHCGPFDLDALSVDNPLVVVEVTSPSSGAVDTGSKLSGYMRTESVQHILILDPVKKTVVHHRRTDYARFESSLVGEGALTLDPPGIEVEVGMFFAAA